MWPSLEDDNSNLQLKRISFGSMRLVADDFTSATQLWGSLAFYPREALRAKVLAADAQQTGKDSVQTTATAQNKYLIKQTTLILRN